MIALEPMARGTAFMSRDRIKSITSHMLIVIALALPRAPAAQAVTAPKRQLQQGTSMVVQRAEDHGIDVVRMPPPGGVAQPSVAATPLRPSAPPPASGLQPQERLLQVPLKISAQPNEVQKGWLGVEMDSLEMPLALSLGLDNANGALILNVMAGGPAAPAGLRLGDVVVRVNGSDVADIVDLRRRVAAMAPGTVTVLGVWRTANDARDFMRLLQRLAVGGEATQCIVWEGSMRPDSPVFATMPKRCAGTAWVRKPEISTRQRRSPVRSWRDAGRRFSSKRGCAG
jgi:membrane-associated protease RseP (regulator of RpoE activity)